ncbi:hypothetical protein ABZ570_04850 [Micromonospora sp. NPDC007271]|uniref:hypothetical protein n=1 Tax=Micromonospora sp. NPDC007271 TaxID=3154587 RepID=UPI0033F3FE18
MSATSRSRPLITEEHGIREITWRLGLARGTVRRFARAVTVDELLAKPTAAGPASSDHLDHLHQRLNAGVTNATQLFTELNARGHRVSTTTVTSAP